MGLTLTLGILIGVVLGLTGAGGGILAVPVLTSSMGLTMQQAAPIALIAVAASSTLGALEGLHKKQARYRAAALMAMVGVPFTSLGILIANVLPQYILKTIFIIVLLIVATRLLKQNKIPEQAMLENGHPTWGKTNPETGRFEWSWPTALLLGSIGSLTGFTSGLLGVGGGFILIPLLRRFTTLTMHATVATSLMVIACVSTGGVFISIYHGTPVPFQSTLYFTLSTLSGMVIGRFLATRLSEQIIQRGFIILVLFVAISLLISITNSFFKV